MPKENVLKRLIHKEEAPMAYAAADKKTRGLDLFIRKPRIIKPEKPPKNCDKGREEAVKGLSENISEISGRIDPAALIARPPVNSSIYRIYVGTFFELSKVSLFCRIGRLVLPLFIIRSLTYGFKVLSVLYDS
jgi:hypothetical protein